MIERTWNVPKQERSRQRFEHILTVAAEMFATHGFDTVTTNHIAEQAEVAIGSLYQFFPNKNAIVDALIFSYILELDKVFQTQMPHDEDLPFAGFIDQLIDGLMAFVTTHIGFSEMLISMNSETMHQIHYAVIENIKQILTHYFPQMSPDQRFRCATIGFGIVKGLMGLDATHSGLSISTQDLITDMKTTIVAYVYAFIEREGI